jgi:hypothetical protein
MNPDEILGQKYGDYAGFTTAASLAEVGHFGEDPLNEVKRLLKIYVPPNESNA